MTDLGTAERAYTDLVALTEQGIRFHGTPGIAAAADWLEGQLAESGLTVTRQRVHAPGWNPGATYTLRVSTPQSVELRTWPLLWSGPSRGLQRGRLIEQGKQGLWGDSMVWRRFVVVDDEGAPLAYVLGRDTGPAAPQPLPAGSDYEAPHFSVSRADGNQLSEWITAGERIEVEFELDCHTRETPAVSDNLIVDIPGSSGAIDTGVPAILVCAHYDAFWNTPGAYDNGSGTIAILQLAKILARTRPLHPVRVVFFTGEEWHLAGSREYVRAASQSHKDGLGYVLNIDGLGRGAFIEAFSGPERFEVAFSTAVRSYIDQTRPGLRVVSRFPPPKGTDDAAFFAAGVPTAFMTFNDLERLHQPEDVPNRAIAANIEWTLGLAQHLLGTLAMPARSEVPGLL